MTQKNIVITGGSGFVGSNLIRKLNTRGQSNIIIIDNYDERKFLNIKDCQFIDYITYRKGISHIEEALSKHHIAAILHIGANADVLVKDAEVMFNANYEHSKFYLDYCTRRNIPLIYASSSAVYGNSSNCIIDNQFEHPHNVYSWSKWMFDKYVLANMHTFESRVIGLRFFNIFGMGEFHKDKNASLPHRFYSFIRDKGFIDLFDKQIERDYVWVEDVCDVILEILNEGSLENGIYNLGSGNPISHRAMAELVVEECIKRNMIVSDSSSLIKSIPMPEELADSFQFHTKAEDLHEIVSKHTAYNKEKIRKYVNQLIDRNTV